MKTYNGVQVGAQRKSQQGMASIIITMVTMVVISLIVLGFATISRREARQSLDQLQSTQAFYAAETGISDARKAIKSQVIAGLPVPSKANCTTNDTGVTLYPTGVSMQLDAASGISYSCLQVDASPTSLQFDGVAADSIVVPISSTSTIRRVEITWTPKAPSGSPTAECPSNITNQFAPQSGANAWKCDYGVMRVDATATSGVMTRASLSSNTYGAFFQPVNYATFGTDNYAGNTATPRLIAANCTLGGTYGSCKAVIDQINTTSLSLRLSSMYQASDVKITAYNNNGAGGTLIPITGVQAEVDVTGKATDVLRRIKVRIPLIATGALLPSSAVNTNGSICKRFATANDYLTIPAILDFDNDNDMCEPMTSGTIDNPAPTGAAGDAGLEVAGPTPGGGSGCSNTSCLPAGAKYRYRQYYTNVSTNPPSAVLGCKWDFGDGVIANNVSCRQGETMKHDYPPMNPEPPYPSGCFAGTPPRTWYTTKLTIYLTNGTSYTDSFAFKVPVCY